MVTSVSFTCRLLQGKIPGIVDDKAKGQDYESQKSPNLPDPVTNPRIQRKARTRRMPRSIDDESDPGDAFILLNEEEVGKGFFSCFHGEEQMRAEAELYDALRIGSFIEEFYEEAVRRLPLEQIPELADCLHAGGHCFGLADPVTNIILNAVALLVNNNQNQGERPHALRPKRFRIRSSYNWFEIACKSHIGLVAFMKAYFRYLSETQARRYVSLATYDLPVAIHLALHDRFHVVPKESPVVRFAGWRLPQIQFPDGGRMQGALRVAALQAQHPAPDVLAQLMAGYCSSRMLDFVRNKMLLQNEPLTVDHISALKHFLSQQSARPPASIQFWCRPGDPNCTQLQDGSLQVVASIGFNQVARISITTMTRNDFDPDNTITGAANDFDPDNTIVSAANDFHPLSCINYYPPRDRIMTIKMKEAWALAHRGAIYVERGDDSPCEFLLSLKLSLLDLIHVFYIDALAILPTLTPNASFLRAFLVAGHCYGPLNNPVFNIIVNTIWYDMAFPLEQSSELPQGILDTRHLARLVSHSLNGMLAVLDESSKHMAFRRIARSCCNTARFHTDFTIVAEAAKHPQYTAFGSFLSHLQCDTFAPQLEALLSVADGKRLLVSQWEKLHLIVDDLLRSKVSFRQPVPKENPCHLLPYAKIEVSRKKMAWSETLMFIHNKVGEVLREYCYQHPWEPSFQLDIVCGVRRSSSSCRSNFYHVNFLATATNAEGQEEDVRTLFFAELWVSSLCEVKLKPSSCRRIDNLYSCTPGRCYVCEGEGNKILHPASGGHFGDIDGSIDLYRPDLHNVDRSDSEELLEADYVYFDPDRDVELAEIINSVHMHGCDAVRLMPRTPNAAPSLPRRWNQSLQLPNAHDGHI